MKKHLFAMCCLAVATAATANGTEISVKNAITGKWISSMEAGDEVSQFEYEDGARLRSVTKTDAKGMEMSTCTFDYSSKKYNGTDYDVMMRYTEGGTITNIYLQVDETGFACAAYACSNSGNGSNDVEYRMEYDTDGHLVHFAASDSPIWYDIVYDGTGDISTVKKIAQDPRSPMGKTEEEYGFEYTTPWDNTPIDNVGCDMQYMRNFGIDLGLLAPAYYAGMLGKATAHLPRMIIRDGAHATEIIWALDADNYPFSSCKKTVGKHEVPGNSDRNGISYKWMSSVSSITDIKADAGTGTDEWYSPNGIRLNSPQRGINILRKADGSTSKVMIR